MAAYVSGAGRHGFGGARAVFRHDLRALGDARGDHRPLALLLLFIGIGLDRGVLTIILGAHHVFNVLRLGGRVLGAAGQLSIARSGRSRAWIWGVQPVRSLPPCDTLPIIAPAVISGLAVGLHAVIWTIW